jgi:hypothetical protein
MYSELITHKHRKRKETFDCYNGFASKYPYSQQSGISSSSEPREYWSNGKASILTIPDMTSSLQETVVTSSKDHVTGMAILNRQTNKVSSSTTTQDVPPDINAVRNSIVAGSVAGISSCLLFHPLDVIRTKIQSKTSMVTSEAATSITTASSRSPGENTISSYRLRTSAMPKSSGVISIFSHTFRNGGLRAFYTGLSLPLGAQAVYKATIFTSNQIIRDSLITWKTNERRKLGNFTPYKLTLSDYFICGASSGAFNAFCFVAPVEYVRNQLIAQHTKLAEENRIVNMNNNKGGNKSIMRGPVDVISRTIKTNGFKGLWRGAGVTLMRDSLGCGSFFLMYEYGQTHLPNLTGYKKDSLVNSIGSGCMAGFGYWFVSLPLDTIKTLVQTGKASSSKEVIETLILRHGIINGAKQIYRGWPVAFGRGSPSAAVTVTVYSFLFSILNKE